MGETTLLPNIQTGARLTLEQFNAPRSALRGNLVPRNEEGVPTRGAGSVGTFQNAFRDGYFTGTLYVGGRPFDQAGRAAIGGIQSGAANFLRPNGGNIEAFASTDRPINLVHSDGTDGVINETITMPGNVYAPSNRLGRVSELVDETEGLTDPGTLPAIAQDGGQTFTRTEGGETVVVQRQFANIAPGGLIINGVLNNGAEVFAANLNRYVGLDVGSGANQEFMLAEVRGTGPGDNFSINNVFRGNQLVGPGGNFGEARTHAQNDTFTALQAVYLYISAIGGGQGEITATLYPVSTYAEEPTDPDVIVYHRHRDNTTWRRRAGQGGAEFVPYPGVFAGIGLRGQGGILAILNAVRQPHADAALASPFVRPIGGPRLVATTTDETMPYRNFVVAQDHSPCLRCVQRGNFEPITIASFTTTDAPDSGELYFAYAPLGTEDSTQTAAFVSRRAPIAVDGGPVGIAHVNPDQINPAVAIAAFIAP